MDLNISDRRHRKRSSTRVMQDIANQMKPQDESTYVELSEDELAEISPATDDVVDDFEDFDSEEADGAESEADRTRQEALRTELIRRSNRPESFNVESCKRFNTQSNCKIRTESFQTSINKPALIQRLKIYRYKKVILKSFKAGLRRKLILLKETFRKPTNLEIPKLWQKRNSLLPEPKLIEASLAQYKRELAEV